MLECEQIFVLGVIILVSKKMRKICALFCSLGVLTGVNNRYSKSCEKCSQSLISYERAQREGNPLGILRLVWGALKICLGTIGFLGSSNLASGAKKDDQEKIENTLKAVFFFVGADGFRDMIDFAYLNYKQADFELLKEIYDKDFRGKSDIILDDLKENDFIASYNSIRLLEGLIEFATYWDAYCNKVKLEISNMFSPKANSLGLDKETMTVNEILEVLEPGAIKKIVNDIVIILKDVSSNINCIKKLKNDYLKGKSTFENAVSKFVEVQSNQQSLEEKLQEHLKNLRYSVDKI